jgi:hypothetical protein
MTTDKRIAIGQGPDRYHNDTSGVNSGPPQFTARADLWL